MRFLISYIKSKRAVLLAAALFIGLFAGSFALYRLPLRAVLYPAALCAFLGTVIFTVCLLRHKARRDRLSRLLHQSAESVSDLPAAETPCESAYRDLALRLRQEVIAEKEKAESAYRDRMDYYTVWAHQVKTPIASMKLTLQNEDSRLARKLNSDLFRTQQYVDMALAFLRLDADSTDFVLKEYSLEQLVRPSIKKFTSDFICKRLTLRYEPSDLKLVTDEKWFSFVLEQLLSNALKYTHTGGIRLYTAEGFILCIADSGIGIAPEDLPRIFEKGYTGYNGRLDRSASGLGLYLCRRVCDQLGIGLRIESEPGKGTTVFLRAEQKRDAIE